MEWLRRGGEEWYTDFSKNKLFIRRVEGYHEVIGGDYYQFVTFQKYLLLSWEEPNRPALKECETLEEAQKELMKLLVKPREEG